MQKKCVSCGLICFLADASCKRCGSTQLEITSTANKSPNNIAPESAKQNISPNYLKYFFFAVGIEVLALVLSFPAWGQMGMHRSANASSSIFEMLCGLLFLVLHFPTLFVNAALMLLTHNEIFLFLTPITQIAFWTYFLARMNLRKMRKQQIV